MSWFQNKIGDPNNFLHQKCVILVGKLGLFFDHLFDGQLGPPQNAHIYIYIHTHIYIQTYKSVTSKSMTHPNNRVWHVSFKTKPNPFKITPSFFSTFGRFFPSQKFRNTATKTLFHIGGDSLTWLLSIFFFSKIRFLCPFHQGQQQELPRNICTKKSTAEVQAKIPKLPFTAPSRSLEMELQPL